MSPLPPSMYRASVVPKNPTGPRREFAANGCKISQQAAPHDGSGAISLTPLLHPEGLPRDPFADMLSIPVRSALATFAAPPREEPAADDVVFADADSPRSSDRAA